MSLDDVLKDMETMNQKEILKQHESYCDIWQGQGKDKRFKTYLPYESGRKLIAKATRKNLENEIVDFYKCSANDTSTLFRTLYYKWLFDYKKFEVSPATLERLHSSYLCYYDNTDFSNTSVKNISMLDVKQFMLHTIDKYHMNYKAYSNFSTIIKNVLELAVDMEIIDTNPFDRVKLGRKTLKPTVKPKSKTEVFTDEELAALKNAIMQEYHTIHVGMSTTPLAVLLTMYTANRSGEICSLKTSDKHDHFLDISRTETSYAIVNTDGTKGKQIHEVKDYPKTLDGIRSIFLTPSAREVYNLILQIRSLNGFEDREYLFLDEKGNRIVRQSLDYHIRKYCKKANFSEKSMHKVRKTVLSKLLHNGVADSAIMEFAGHKDIETTRKYYDYTEQSQEIIQQQFTNIIDHHAI